MAISNLHKAAVLLISLPQQAAARVLEKLPSEQALALRREMDCSESCGREERDSVLQEFAAIVRDTAAATSKDGVAATQEQGAFSFLQRRTPETLAALLRDEHPQTVALALFHVPPQLAAETIAMLPSEHQAMVLRRIAGLILPGPEILQDVERAVEHRLNDEAGRPAVAGLRSIVKIFNAMQPAGERQLLGELARTDVPLFDTIRRAMFGADVVGAA